MTEETSLYCNLCWHLDGEKVPVPYGVVINQRAFDLCEKHFKEPLERFELDYLDLGEPLTYSVQTSAGKKAQRPDRSAFKRRYAASQSRHMHWKSENSSSLPSRPPLVPGFHNYAYLDDED
jgi:hypothetical protein